VGEGKLQLIFILEQVLNGLLIGVYYLLIALGLSLIFSLGGIVNLAHGAFYAIGAYLAVLLTNRIGFIGSFLAAPIFVGLIGIAIERSLFRRFYRTDPALSDLHPHRERGTARYVWQLFDRLSDLRPLLKDQ